jgi:hypothetical protein
VICQIDEKIELLINQLIGIRELILPKEIDMAKNFYSHRLFHEMYKEESMQSANALEIVKKKSN